MNENSDLIKWTFEQQHHTHLEEEILAVVGTAVMNHDKIRLHYPSLVTQLNESRHRVLPCTQIKGENEMKGHTNIPHCRG